MARFDESNFDEGNFDEDEPPTVRRKKMTSLQIDDVLGFAKLLQGAAVQYKAKMVANDYDPTNRAAAVATSTDTLTGSKNSAANAQIEATRLTGIAEKQKQTLYTELSSWCDTMAGAVGKTTPEGKAILAIRANLSGRGPNAKKTPPPA